MNKSKRIKIISSVITCMGLATGFVATSNAYVNNDGIKVFNENTKDIIDFDNMDNLFNNTVGETFNVTPEGGIEIKCTVLTEPTADKNGTVSVQGIDGISGHLIIPELVTYEGNDYDVTTIPDEGFFPSSKPQKYDGDLIIPKSITSIGGWAFASITNSDDAKLTIYANIEAIPGGCFSPCNFTEVEILSNTIERIEGAVFYIKDEANKLSKVTTPPNLTSFGGDTFSGNKNIKEMIFLSKTVPSYVDYWTFAEVSPTKIYVRPNLIDEYKSKWTIFSADLFDTLAIDFVNLDQTNVNALINDEPIKLNATVQGEYDELIWSSSDESVVSVDYNGQLTYNSPGKAVITVESGIDSSKFATCEIEITEPQPEPEPKNNNLALILGLSLGIGIPIVVGIGFGTYYFINKNKK